MSNISVDGLSDLIGEYMSDYSEEVTGNLKKAVDTVSKEVNDEIKKHITFKEPTGKYVKSFRISKAYEDGYKKVNRWHVVNGQYRLAHLLEHGHALWQGGRSRAYHHIKYGDELAQRRMEELAEEAVKDAGR
ncbi:HK97 gp10 family phage protein [Clostridium thailandense]|uniref:HK97 gp10 family phage protein n=1 Tax=Clostridium thailandense TaxID=2794346 RepID=UPI003988B890